MDSSKGVDVKVDIELNQQQLAAFNAMIQYIKNHY